MQTNYICICNKKLQYKKIPYREIFTDSDVTADTYKE